MTTHPVPASVLVGFLGSGKTTLLKHILTERHRHKIAVIVNDFAELNIDARLVRHAEERIVEMSNGCICCTLREDLLQELRTLSEIEDLDYILIESTGIGEPLPIAQTFYMEDLPERVRLDSIITVVDASAFWQDYDRSDTIEDAEGNPVESPLAPLLVEQLEFTNIGLLNKVDRANGEDLNALEGFVKQLNPKALIYRSSYAQIDPSLLIGTGLYDYEAGLDAQDWAAEWAKNGSEAEEYGFQSFVYRQAQPFIWERFLAIFREWPTNVIRAKGFVTFEDHNPVILSLAGEDLRLEELAMVQELSPAAASLTPAEQQADVEAWADSSAGAMPGVGPTELVVIGRNLPQAELRRLFDGCFAPASVVAR